MNQKGKELLSVKHLSFYNPIGMNFYSLNKLRKIYWLLIKAMTVILPWRIKRLVLIRVFHYDVDKSAHIGLSWIFPGKLVMKQNSKIDNLNVAIHLDVISMEKNSSISRSNWITGFPTHTGAKFFKHDVSRRSELIIGQDSAVTKHHHIDCTNSVQIGCFTTIAGYNSVILTHSIDIHKNRQDSFPIKIGDYCFVGTSCVILGGAELPNRSVLAAGGVLTSKFHDELYVYGGVPAKPIKQLNEDDKYFNRTSGYVY